MNINPTALAITFVIFASVFALGCYLFDRRCVARDRAADACGTQVAHASHPMPSARLSRCEHLWLCGIAKRQALLKAERQSPEFKRSMQIQIDLLKWCLEDLKTVQDPEAQLPSRIP